MIKAAREARRRTSWVRPNGDYESRLTAFIDATMDSREFMREFQPFMQTVARAGVANSLVHTVLKLTLAGVPDIYQGSELWDLSLVDPDNRRPVDYAQRASMLATLLADFRADAAATVHEAVANWQDGRIKLLLTALLLDLRRNNDALANGDYLPCEVAGAANVGAYLRRSGSSAVLVVFERFPLSRADSAARESLRIALPPARSPWRDVLFSCEANPENEPLRCAQLPVAVFVTDDL